MPLCWGRFELLSEHQSEGGHELIWRSSHCSPQDLKRLPGAGLKMTWGVEECGRKGDCEAGVPGERIKARENG